VTAAAPAPEVLHLSLIAGGDLVDASGLRLGRIEDLIVRLGGDQYPPVTGALATVAGRAVFVPDEFAPYEGGSHRNTLRARLVLRHRIAPSVGVDEWARFWAQTNGALDGPKEREFAPDTTV
jgi:hypothetical protein